MPSGSGAVISVTAGPKAGSEFPLEGDEIVIGRANDATISIPDTSVSRKHAAIRREGNGWVVADMGSGNGTIVNGEPITEDRPLVSGDVITLGDTELTFRDESNATVARPAPTARPNRPGHDSTNPVANAPPPRPSRSRPDVRARLSRGGPPAEDPEAQKKKKKMMIFGAAGVVLILLIAVGVNIQNKKKQQQQGEIAALVAQERQTITNTFQAGKNAAAKGQWTDAKAKFEEAIGMAAAGQSAVRPEGHPELVDAIQTYLDRANVEIPSQEALAVAEKKLEENLLGDAAAALNKVSDNAATATYDKKKELKTALNKKIDARLSEARAALAAGGSELEKARDIAADIVTADANHRDAKVIKEQAEAAIVQRDKPPEVRPGVKIDPWAPAVARYRDGDTTAALSILDECAAKKALGKDANRCKTIAGDVREAMGMFKKIEDLDGKALDKLLRLDRSITGGGLSKMGRQAGTQAGTKFCKMASSAKQSGQWGKAAEWANKALESDPESNCAKALMSDLRGRCKDTYMRAYSIKDTQPDDALPLFRDAVQLCGADEETRGKAQGWITKIERGG